MKLKVLIIPAVLLMAGCSSLVQPPKPIQDPDNQSIRRAVTHLAIDGDVGSQMLLSKVYYYGEGVPIDKRAAAMWLRDAAEQGHSVGQFNLGEMQFFGDGIPKNDSMAVHWLQRSAEQGNIKAQNLLAHVYQLSVEMKDDVKSVKWAQEAAERGVMESQLLLGLLYKEGTGTPKNLTKAAHWIRKAAQQGDENAQLILGRMYYDGHGVLRSYVSSYMWSSLAKQNGAKESFIKGLAAIMTPQEIEVAQEKAKKCLITRYKDCY